MKLRKHDSIEEPTKQQIADVVNKNEKNWVWYDSSFYDN